MYYGLYISAAGAHAQNQKVEILSNNLANVDTVGFKRELALLEARDAEAIERGLLSRGSQAIEDIGGGVRLAGTATDFSLGALKPTGIPTDLALEDKTAFFAIERDGQELLTRAGNFQLRNDGVMTTADGDPVLSTDGSPIQVDPDLPWRFLPGGVIDQAGDLVELAVFKVETPQGLIKMGTNSFAVGSAEVQPALADDRRIRTGYLEMSDVDSVTEMVDLIATSRSYETNIRMIQNHDSMTASLVSRMMRPA
jgi:flagellar basal-body rod protein FlgF